MKVHYGEKDDVFTIYDDEHAPSETIEFSEFLNIDIDKDRGVVGLEVFYASEFFSALNEVITKNILESFDDVRVESKNFRNNWFTVIVFEKEGKEVRVQLPPLRKTDYSSPLLSR